MGVIIAGISPVCRDALYSVFSGWLNSCVHSLSSRAGNSSGPSTALFETVEIASRIFCCMIKIFVRVLSFLFSSCEKKFEGSSIVLLVSSTLNTYTLVLLF